MSKNQEIPNGWALVKLSDLVVDPKKDLVDGPFGSDLKADEYTDSGVPVFKIQNIKANQFLDKKINYIKKEKAKSLSRHSFISGDLIITKLGYPLGLCCKVPEKYKYGIIVADLMRLRPNKMVVYDQFLIYAINCNVVQNQFKAITKGTTRPRVNLTIVRDIELALPPLLEQQRIVARIEELFSSLDKGIESLKTAQQQLKIYRQSVLKWAFEGKLTNKNVKEGELPEGWKWLKLDDVVDEFVRGPFGGSLKKECFVPKGYKVYEQKNAIYQSTELGKYFINENKFKELIRFKVKPYDFIVSCSGTIGKLFMIPEKAPKGIINQALLIIRINRDLLLEKFFMHLFTSSFFQRLIIKDAKGTAMLNLAGVKDMKLVPVLLPPIREQQAIVAEIESRLSVCDKIEESIEQSLKQAEALRQSILKKAFEGKLFSQDPNDEPASKLLERIKVEREKTAIKKRSKN
ncbi:MAG: restriction endonuclease subunit S [Smithellaceae bacterium]